MRFLTFLLATAAAAQTIGGGGSSGNGGGGTTPAGTFALTGAQTPSCASGAVTLSLSAVSNKSPARFECTLTGNVTSVTINSIPPGGGDYFEIAWTQGTGGPYTVTYGAGVTKTCELLPLANSTTTQSLRVTKAGAIQGYDCTNDQNILWYGGERSSPGSPTSGHWAWLDSTAHNLRDAYASGTFALFKTGGDANPDSGAVTAFNGAPLSRALKCADSSSSATAYVCATSVSFTPAVGDSVTLTGINQANSGSATLAVNGASAATLKKFQGSASLATNDLAAGGAVVVTFDGTYWQAQGQLASAPTSVGATGMIDLPAGGYNTSGANVMGPWINQAGTGYTNFPNQLYVAAAKLASSGTSTNTYIDAQFRLPYDMDRTKTVYIQYLVADSDSSSASGNFKLNASIACISAGSNNMAANPSFGSVVSSTMTVSGYYPIIDSGKVGGLDMSTCTADGQVAILQVARDNTVGSNSVDNLYFLDASIIYSRK